MKKKRYSIKEIAQKSGVSAATVSRVMNDSKFVSKELKEKVLKTIEETGYKPNLTAQSLAKNKTQLIGVLIPRISNSYFSALLEGIEIEAQNNGYNILLSTSYSDRNKELDYLNIFEDRQMDGVIFSVTEFVEEHQLFFENTFIPSVFMGQEISALSYPYITIDNLQAGYDATKYLLDNGHKRIGVLSGPIHDTATGIKRIKGYTKALREYNLTVDKRLIQSSLHTIDNGYQETEKLFKENNDITAIFACSDQKAIGALKYLQANNYKVPDDVSIVGFDDIDLAEVVSPTLTTIHQDPKEMGQHAVKLIVNQMNEEKEVPKKNVFSHKLIERESIKKLNKD